MTLHTRTKHGKKIQGYRIRMLPKGHYDDFSDEEEAVETEQKLCDSEDELLRPGTAAEVSAAAVEEAFGKPCNGTDDLTLDEILANAADLPNSEERS